MENMESQQNPQMSANQFPTQGNFNAVRSYYEPNHSRPLQSQTYFTPQRFRFVRPQTLPRNAVPHPTNGPRVEGPSFQGHCFMPGPSARVPFRQPYMPAQQRFVPVPNTEVSQDFVQASNVMSFSQNNVHLSQNVGPVPQNGPQNVMSFPGQFMQPSGVPMYCRPVTFYRAVVDPRTGFQTVVPQTVLVPQPFVNMDAGAGPKVELEGNTAEPIVEETNEGPGSSTWNTKIECQDEVEDRPQFSNEITNPDNDLRVNLPSDDTLKSNGVVTHLTTSFDPEEVRHQNYPAYRITRKLIEIVDPNSGEKLDVARLANSRKGKKIEIIDPKTGQQVDFKHLNMKQASPRLVETETINPVEETVEPKDSASTLCVEEVVTTVDVITKCEESVKEEPVSSTSDETSEPPKLAEDDAKVEEEESVEPNISSVEEVVPAEGNLKCDEPVPENPDSCIASEESQAELNIEVQEEGENGPEPEESAVIPPVEEVTPTEAVSNCEELLKSEEFESSQSMETPEKSASDEVVSEVKVEEDSAPKKVEEIESVVVEIEDVLPRTNSPEVVNDVQKEEASLVTDHKISESPKKGFVQKQYVFEGMRKYQRNALLDILENMSEVRLVLPNFDIVRREPHGFKVPRDFDYRDKHQGHHVFEARKEVVLHKSESAWQAPKNAEKNDTEGLLGRLKGILNKLTPQFFDALMEQIKELPIDSEERLSGCINLIFEQSVIQPVFSSLYANMAKNLSNLAVPSKEDSTKVVKFRKLLLDKCQSEFVQEKQTEKIIADIQKQIDNAKSESEKKILEENKMESAAKAKRRYLGTIRLIGELYKLTMLTENIMHECLVKLLNGSGDEDSIECLCNLLTTIGKDIDNPKSKGRVDLYFAEMGKLIKAKTTSTRIRFMMIDLAELRKNKWVPRQKVEGPKKIDQIHKEAVQVQQKKVESTANKTPWYQNKVPSTSVVIKPKVSQPSAGDWTSVHHKPMKMEPISLKNFNNFTTAKTGSEVKLGPSRGIWNKGSSSGTTKANEKSTFPSFFAPLANLDNDEDDKPAAVQQKLPSEHKSSAKVPAQVQRENRLELEISREEMAKKVKSRVDEYVELKDLDEAVDTIKELHVESCFKNSVRFFYFSIEQNIEKSSKVREAVGLLHMTILKNSVATVEAYAAALGMLTRFADDIAVDVPQIWSYLAEAVSPVFSGGSDFKLNVLISTSEEDMEEEFESEDDDNTARLLAAVLSEVSAKQGKVVASEIWEASGLKWEELVKKQPVEGFLKKFLKY